MSVETIEEALNEKINEQSGDDSSQGNEESITQTEEQSHEENNEWQPDFSYSIKDEKHEFDEWIRPSITDAEKESQIRELYTRAQGLDHVKSNLEQERERIKELQRREEELKYQAETYKTGVDGLKELAKTDFPSFAHLAGIDDQTILTYANQRLDYKEKPEHERKMIDEDMNRRTQSYQSHLEVENLRRQNDQLMRDRHTQSMSVALAQPEIETFRKAFDSRMGEGSFMQHVNDYGSTQFRTTQRYVEPTVAIQHVYSQFKPLFVDKLEEINKAGDKSKNIQKPPTNLGTGRTTSVVKKRVKRLSDLRKVANELARHEANGY
jgi:hypothetical protein